MARPVLRLWTDGAQQPGGNGGWAFVAEQSGVVVAERSGVLDRIACSNVAELHAVAEALAYAAELPNPGTLQACICTDSSYIRDGIEAWLPTWIRNDWQPVGRRGGRSSKPIRNRDTWQRIADLSERLPRLRPVRRVKAHSGAHFNEPANRLAEAAAKGGSQ